MYIVHAATEWTDKILVKIIVDNTMKYIVLVTDMSPYYYT